MQNFAIETGEGLVITTGVSEQVARRMAHEFADTNEEPVYMYEIPVQYDEDGESLRPPTVISPRRLEEQKTYRVEFSGHATDLVGNRRRGSMCGRHVEHVKAYSVAEVWEILGTLYTDLEIHAVILVQPPKEF
jgi:hypothetical protein